MGGKEIPHDAHDTTGTASRDGLSSASEITSWVESHYTSTTVGGVTVYDLTSASS